MQNYFFLKCKHQVLCLPVIFEIFSDASEKNMKVHFPFTKQSNIFQEALGKKYSLRMVLYIDDLKRKENSSKKLYTVKLHCRSEREIKYFQDKQNRELPTSRPAL